MSVHPFGYVTAARASSVPAASTLAQPAQVLGDPAEAAALSFVGWRLTSTGATNGSGTLTIVKRMPFTSRMRRMQTTVKVDGPLAGEGANLLTFC